MTFYDDLFSVEGKRLVELDILPSAVHASFGLYHEELDPEEITTRLQVQPSRCHRKGDQRLGKDGRVYSPFSKGAWRLSSKGKIDSLDANQHILWILDELSHCHFVLRQLRRDGYEMSLKCAWFASSDNTCPSLNVETIRRLAQFKLDFWFDVYL